MPAKSLILKDRDFPEKITLTISIRGKHMRFAIVDKDGGGEHVVTVVMDEYKMGMKYLKEPKTQKE